MEIIVVLRWSVMERVMADWMIVRDKGTYHPLKKLLNNFFARPPLPLKKLHEKVTLSLPPSCRVTRCRGEFLGSHR